MIDVIDRKALIYKIRGIVPSSQDVDFIVRLIEEQPKTDWIPCEERLPNTLGVYQTVRKVIEGDRNYYLEGASYFDGQNTWHNDIGVNHGREHPNVIAWQPIQPYKREGADDE